MKAEVRINAHERAHCVRVITLEGERNTERAFWQSRMTTVADRAELPDLLDIPAFANEMRRTWR